MKIGLVYQNEPPHALRAVEIGSDNDSMVSLTPVQAANVGEVLSVATGQDLVDKLFRLEKFTN